MKPEKNCATCGRRMTWRKKWANCWDEVKYCSEKCRLHRPTDGDAAIENMILFLLRSRKPGATICPSEAVRALHPDAWRPHMETARNAARRLVDRGLIEITQQGHVVDPSSARGPIRLRMKSP
jgi:hypothetical protein